MKILDLFSGIGGFSLGLERAGMETAAFCEYDEKARKVLSKHWPDVPIYEDVRTLTGEQLEKDGIGDIGLICGGYPCQPFSVAGKRQGKDDDRHLWPEFFRLIQEIRPAWVIAENVAGHINMGLDSVLADLDSEAYQCQTFLIPACSVGAFHRRDRIWIVAHTPQLQRDGGDIYGINNQRSEGREQFRGSGGKNGSGRRKNVADTLHKRLQGRQEVGSSEISGAKRDKLFARRGERSEPGNWLPEPPVGRVANGVPRRVDRLKQLGNAVVPQIPEIIGRAILEAGSK